MPIIINICLTTGVALEHSIYLLMESSSTMKNLTCSASFRYSSASG